MRWLNFHAGYACRDSGMCCSSGWPIPVESLRVGAIAGAIAGADALRDAPWLVAEPGAPDDVAGTLAFRPNGHCIFFEARGRGCAIHAVKPAACTHFPYVCLIDQRGVHVTLSHYCPTAVAMLFEHTGPIATVEGPLPVSDAAALEGLDARDSLPPLREQDPGPKTQDRGPILMSFDELSAWESEQVAEAKMDVLRAEDVDAFAHARAAVPPPWSWPAAPHDFAGAWWSLVAPGWERFAGVLNRYAAAKLFASWAAYYGKSVADVRRAAEVAAAVLRVECARQCLEKGQPLDRELLTQAIRQSDLLLMHYADPDRLYGPAPLNRPPTSYPRE